MNKRICMGLLMVTMLMSCATQQKRAGTDFHSD